MPWNGQPTTIDEDWQQRQDTAPVDDELAQIAVDAWILGLGDVRADDEDISDILDGTLHVFALPSRKGPLRGQIKAPPKGSVPDRLVGMARALEQYALSNEDERPAIRTRMFATARGW